LTSTLRQEVWRKVVHLATAALPAWIYFAPAPWVVHGPLLAFLGVLTLDGLRLARPGLGSWVDRRLGSYLRPEERRALVVPVHLLTGSATLLAAVAPPAIAATALAYLVFGDAAAALVGRKWGRPRFGRKSLEGSVACAAACLAVGALLLPGRGPAIVGGALVATLVEALPSPVDDNWSVPLVSALTLVLLV
jgi:dolichol kinase